MKRLTIAHVKRAALPFGLAVIDRKFANEIEIEAPYGKQWPGPLYSIVCSYSVWSSASQSSDRQEGLRDAVSVCVNMGPLLEDYEEI